jgi:hypothetical protein
MSKVKDPEEIDNTSSHGENIVDFPIPTRNSIKAFQHKLRMGRGESASPEAIIKLANSVELSVKSGDFLM